MLKTYIFLIASDYKRISEDFQISLNIEWPMISYSTIMSLRLQSTIKTTNLEWCDLQTSRMQKYNNDAFVIQ